MREGKNNPLAHLKHLPVALVGKFKPLLISVPQTDFVPYGQIKEYGKYQSHGRDAAYQEKSLLPEFRNPAVAFLHTTHLFTLKLVDQPEYVPVKNPVTGFKRIGQNLEQSSLLDESRTDVLSELPYRMKLLHIRTRPDFRTAISDILLPIFLAPALQP